MPNQRRRAKDLRRRLDRAVHHFSEIWEFRQTLRRAVTTLHPEQKLPTPPKGPAIDGCHFPFYHAASARHVTHRAMTLRVTTNGRRRDRLQLCGLQEMG
jgi:hypothetical protein